MRPKETAQARTILTEGAFAPMKRRPEEAGDVTARGIPAGDHGIAGGWAGNAVEATVTEHNGSIF